MTRRVLIWRRIDLEGLERLELTVGDDGVEAAGTVISLEAGGLKLEHRWSLDADWRTNFVRVDRWGTAGRGRLLLERDGAGWRVDGRMRPDLDAAEEPDLSVTPFCNSLPIRRLRESLTLDTAYIDGAALTVTRSRQRYERLSDSRVRYIDLGVSHGFEAELDIDELGLVFRYQHLFEQVCS